MPAIYCHNCMAQFSVPQNEGVCPSCGGGFVEEVAQAAAAAAGPAGGVGSGGSYSRTYTLPGGGTFSIVTSSGGGLPPGMGGGFGGGFGGAGDQFVNSVVDMLLGAGFMQPGVGGRPSAARPMPPTGGGPSAAVPRPPTGGDPFAARPMPTTGGGLSAAMPLPPMGGGLQGEQEWLDQVLSQIMNEYQPLSQAASQRAVRSLPKLSVRATDARGEPGEGEALARAGEPCSVCHDEYRQGEEVLELPCGHNYHADCLLPWLEAHNTCPVCRHELPAEDPQVEAGRRRRAQQAQQAPSSSRRQQPEQQRQGGGRLADLLDGINARWESFRDSMAHADEPAGEGGSSQAGADPQRASQPAGQVQQAAAHAQQAAAAGSSDRFGTAGSSESGRVQADGPARAATSARPTPTSSADGLRQRREAAAIAAERRMQGDSAASLLSQPSQHSPPPAPAHPAHPAAAARPAEPPRPAASSRVQPPPPAVVEQEDEEEGGDGVVAGALLGGALGAVLGGALMLLGRRGQRDRS